MQFLGVIFLEMLLHAFENICNFQEVCLGSGGINALQYFTAPFIFSLHTGSLKKKKPTV